MHSVAPSLVDLLDSLAFVAVEHGESLDLLRFANLVDLYAHHLGEAGRGTARVPFEVFVRDGRRLAEAAETAGRESGVATAVPSPLGNGPESTDLSHGTFRGAPSRPPMPDPIHARAS